jgi:hypothetical protein
VKLARIRVLDLNLPILWLWDQSIGRTKKQYSDPGKFPPLMKWGCGGVFLPKTCLLWVLPFSVEEGLLLPPPTFFAQDKRAKANKASKFAREAPIKIFASTFETCRSSDLCNYMICYIIIGHMGNKIQILLDIDNFFSFFFKKTQIYFYFWKKLSIKNGVD